jgi:hypothetical protein
MRSARPAPLALVAIALLLGVYVISDLVLWNVREEIVYALTVNRRCIRTKQMVAAPRFAWMNHRRVWYVSEWAYSPINALRVWSCSSPP